ncbi:hypothetical protein CLI75_11695, partial [Porphyromonas gingivalis]
PTGIQTGAKLPSVDVVHSGDTEPDRAVADIHLTETVANEEFVRIGADTGVVRLLREGRAV